MNLHQMMFTLNKAKIAFTLSTCREDAVLIAASVPGQRWEIEIFEDGSIETEIFLSDGDIFDEQRTLELIKKFSDDDQK